MFCERHRGKVIPTDHYEDVYLNGYQSNVGIVIPSQVRAFVPKVVERTDQSPTRLSRAP